VEEMGARQLDHALCLPNGLEMSRPASASILARTRFAAAGQVGSIELLGAGSVRFQDIVYRSVSGHR